MAVQGLPNATRCLDLDTVDEMGFTGALLLRKDNMFQKHNVGHLMLLGLYWEHDVT